MGLLARLVPRMDPNEVLIDGLAERRTIDLRNTDDGNSSIVLGRGAVTGISDRTIGTSVVQLIFDDNSSDEQTVRATLMKDADKSKVHVNGICWKKGTESTLLGSGDVISLDGLRYEYQLRISEAPENDKVREIDEQQDEGDVILISSSPSMTSLAAKAPPPPPPAASVASSTTCSKATESAVTLTADMVTRLSDELQCSVCLDIQVQPRTLDPCGHSFCSGCLKDLKDCPQCREKINSHVPAMQLGSLIEMLVSVPSLLNKEDVEHYKERKLGQKLTPVVYHKKRPKKRQRYQRSTAEQSSSDNSTMRTSLLSPSLSLFQRQGNRPQWAGAPVPAPTMVDLSAANAFFLPPNPFPAVASLPTRSSPRRNGRQSRISFQQQSPAGQAQVPQYSRTAGTSSSDAISID